MTSVAPSTLHLGRSSVTGSRVPVNSFVRQVSLPSIYRVSNHISSTHVVSTPSTFITPESERDGTSDMSCDTGPTPVSSPPLRDLVQGTLSTGGTPVSTTTELSTYVSRNTPGPRPSSPSCLITVVL